MCRAVIEAAANDVWLVRLIEPLSEKLLLPNPEKPRVIIESARKSDTLDFQLLADFLALNVIPTSHWPTPRQRDHRRLAGRRNPV